VHPAAENARRRDAVAYLHARRRDFLPRGAGLEVDVSAPYEPGVFLGRAAASPDRPERCAACYAVRLEAAAARARRDGCSAFTSSLLYSRKQDHAAAAREGARAARESGARFLYRDFREGWKEGREIAKALGVYRQNYCGCVNGETDS
jgi:predicted adenine nucleotide alpha hydrolase (AANH) superfamily ATPase